jgi:hypothetical protein
MKYALCVGINEYIDKDNTLRGCRNDAFDMAAFFQIELGVPKENVVILLDRAATKDNIMTELENMKAKARPGDYLANSHSSHGTQQPDKDGDELDYFDEALCCTNTRPLAGGWDPKTIILDDELRNYCTGLPDGVRFEAWFDTCHSGSALRQMGLSYDRARVMLADNDRLERLRDVKRMMGIIENPETVLWAACEADKLSADTFLDGKWCGAFTNAFLTTYHPKLARGTILNLVREKLRQGGYDQVPQLDLVKSAFRKGLVGT